MMDLNKRELIEKIGVFHEKFGFQPVAARIYGLLLVSEKIELTFDEIRTELNISKSATSNALTLLMSMKQVDYITKPGDRKRYFKSNLDKWKQFMSDLLNIAKNYSELFSEVYNVRDQSQNIDFNKTIKELISFIEYIVELFPEMIENWQKRQA